MNGFTDYGPHLRRLARTQRTRNRRRLLYRCILACAGAAMLAAPLVRHGWFRADPSAKTTLAPIISSRGALRGLSDMGFPLRLRPDNPDHWRGVVVARAPQGAHEFTLLDERPLGETSEPKLVDACRQMLLEFWADAKLNQARTGDKATTPDFDLHARQWAWLAREGIAGHRSIRSGAKRGLSPQEHYDTWRGVQTGFVIGATGFTEYTHTTIYYISATGDDSTGTGAIGAPWQSPYLGRDAWTTGQAVAILHKRGDTWNGTVVTYPYMGSISKSGASAESPTLIGTYGTGARPKFDCDSQTAAWGELRLGASNFVHFQGLEIYDSDYDGGTTGQAGVTGITITDGVTDCQIEDCYIHGLTNAVTATAGSGPLRRILIRRNIFEGNYSTTTSQAGTGCFLQGFDVGLTIEENIIDHNGWTETATTHAGTAVAVTANSITLAAGASSLDDAYNGGTVTSGGKTGNVTDYNGTTKVCTIGSWTGGTPALGAYSLVGSQRRQFCHNLYVTDTNEGFSCLNNIITRGANHGIGRRNGTISYNFCEDNGTGIRAATDASHADGASVISYNVCAMLAGDILTTHGISQIAGIEQDAAAAGAASLTQNCILGATVTNAGIATYGISIGAYVSDHTTTANTIYGVHNSATGEASSLRLRPSSGSPTYTATGNTIVEPTGSYLVNIENAGGTPTFVLANTYAWPSSGNAFYNFGVGARTFAQWQSDYGDTGAFSTSPAAVFSSPDRRLADYESGVLGGTGTLAAALATLKGYTQSTWNEAEHGVRLRLNWTRAGRGMAAVALLWTQDDTLDLTHTGALRSVRALRGESLRARVL